jgi:hypothetical protein
MMMLRLLLPADTIIQKLIVLHLVGGVLTNDTLNGNPVKHEDVNISIVSGSNLNISLDNFGNVTVQVNFSGSYVLTYQICQKQNPTCHTAK